MLQESTYLDVAADKDNSPVGGRQKDVIAEPRGKKRFREEGKNDRSIVVNRDGCLSSLASSTLNVELSELKRSEAEQENMNSDPLPYNLGDCSHGLAGNPTSGQREPWTSGACNGKAATMEQIFHLMLSPWIEITLQTKK
uniref:Uncharacterized protein n=1 Tax=Arundo donax TaxID=35708 RepID=A0A0A9HBW5_ARUDO